MESLQVAAGISAATVLFLGKSLWNYRRLPALPAAAPTSTSGVTVIIPARNEVRNIRDCVGGFPSARVIVVDDGSEDGTAAAASKAGAFVIAPPPLAQGAFGKPNACQAGADAARTDWLLFVDADTRYEPAFLASLVSYCEERQLDMATCFLRQVTGSFFETILIPYAFALYFTGVHAAAVNSPASSEALANGQCLLVRRSAYQRLGGHAAVLDSVIEDVALAAVAKEKGVKFQVLRAEQFGSVRMYEDLPSIWRGFQKNSFRFLLVNPVSGIQVILASVLLTSYLPVLLLLLFQDQYRAAIAFALLPTLLLFPWYSRKWGAFFAPLAIYLFQLIALAGMFSAAFGWKTTWKGREV